jgi:DNA-binding Xre family transcriptional regulator
MFNHMPMRWKLSELAKSKKVTARQIMLESGLSSNTVYPIARGTSSTVSLETMSKIISAMRTLTGDVIEVGDLLEFSEQ